METDLRREEVRRVLSSPQFRRAPKLQRFLELICDYSLEERPQEISEYLIATQAFGKGPDFDPGQDSIVRVQAREVRRRLHEYYQSDGKDSRLTLDIPAGSYMPVFTAVAPVKTPAAAPIPVRRWWLPAQPAWVMLLVTALVCVVLLFAADRERRLLLRSSAMAAGRINGPALGPPVTILWNRFLESDVPTILVLSNPEVGPCTEAANPRGTCPDEYTGMGEAVAIHLITNLFRTAKQTLIVKQSRMTNADDAKRYNLILLGGKAVNVWTRRLGADLSLNAADPRIEQRYATTFDGKTGQLLKDRALIALRRHPDSGNWLLFLYGNHSQGTHAAAEASTDAHFLSQIKWPGGGIPDSFRVLVGVTVNDGIPEGLWPAAVQAP